MNYYGINLLPCSNPPAMQIILADTSLMTQINATLSGETRSIPFAGAGLGNLDVTVNLMITEFASRYVLTVRKRQWGSTCRSFSEANIVPINFFVAFSAYASFSFVDARWSMILLTVQPQQKCTSQNRLFHSQPTNAHQVRHCTL